MDKVRRVVTYPHGFPPASSPADKLNPARRGLIRRYQEFNTKAGHRMTP